MAWDDQAVCLDVVEKVVTKAIDVLIAYNERVRLGSRAEEALRRERHIGHLRAMQPVWHLALAKIQLVSDRDFEMLLKFTKNQLISETNPSDGNSVTVESILVAWKRFKLTF